MHKEKINELDLLREESDKITLSHQQTDFSDYHSQKSFDQPSKCHLENYAQ